MGLFDKFLKKPETSSFTYSPSEHEGWIGILMACMAADGDMDPFEIDVMAKAVALKTTFTGVDFGALLTKVMDAKNKLGAMGLVEACSKVVKETDKATLFTMAVEIVLADGSIDTEEEMVVNAVAKELNIDEVIAEKIIEVMLIRNYGNLVL
ncbi:MAG: TerB family tellurite resistance protein [Bacteroidota bacterium]